MPTIKNHELKQAENLKNNWKFKEALDFLDNFEKDKDLTPLERFQLYFLKSSILVDLLDSEEAMKYADLAYKESKKIGMDFEIIKTLTLRCHIFRSMLEPSKALEMINEAEDILARNNQKSSKEFKMVKGHVLVRKGCHYFTTGALNRGLRLFSEATQLANEIHDKKLKILTTKWLSFLYSVKGESNRAFEYKTRYLALAIDLDDKQEIIGAHNTIGIELTEKGEIKRAIEHLEKSLSLCYEIKSWKTFIVSTSLFDTYMKINYIEKAQQLHDHMGKLIREGTYKFNEEAYRLQEAALLKKDPTESKLLKAEKIYKEVADKETAFIEFKIDALVNICDLYLKRLKQSNDLKELDKIIPYTDQLRFMAVNEGIHSLLAEMFLFQAKLKLVSFEFKESQDLLARALNIAQNQGLNLIAQKVENEQIDLSRNFLKWEKLRTTGVKISVRMDLARVDEQIQILLQKRNYLKNLTSS
ncbi:MAG: hypothetical protein ACXABG_03345 [Promethearchaeota archaeon]